MASETACISGTPSSFAKTQLAKKAAKPSMDAEVARTANIVNDTERPITTKKNATAQAATLDVDESEPVKLETPRNICWNTFKYLPL